MYLRRYISKPTQHLHHSPHHINRVPSRTLVPSPVPTLTSQVSHHPPIGALFAEGPSWTYEIVSAPTTKFLGNSIEIRPLNRSRVTLKNTGEQVRELRDVPPT